MNIEKNKNKFIRKEKVDILNKKTLIGVIFFLILLNVGTYFYTARNEGTIKRIQKKDAYSFLNPARNFFEKEDLIVNIQPLRDDLTKMGEDPNVSIYFEFLNTGANIAVNKDMTIYPASLMKIPIAMAVMKKVENGDWRLDSEMVLYEKDKDERFGELHEMPEGTRLSVERLLLEMLIKSDNTARGIFMRNLQKIDIDDVLDHLGIEDIFDSNNKITAKKYSIFWRSLYTSSYLSEENSQKLLEIMAKSETNEYLSIGLPGEINFSHKIGVVYDDNIYSDSGLVYVPKRPFIITVMIQGHEQAEAENIMKSVAEKTYNYVSNY